MMRIKGNTLEFYYVNNYLMIHEENFLKLPVEVDAEHVIFTGNSQYQIDLHHIPCKNMGCVNMLNIDEVMEFLSIEMIEQIGNFFKFSAIK